MRSRLGTGYQVGIFTKKKIRPKPKLSAKIATTHTRISFLIDIIPGSNFQLTNRLDIDLKMIQKLKAAKNMQTTAMLFVLTLLIAFGHCNADSGVTGNGEEE